MYCLQFREKVLSTREKEGLSIRTIACRFSVSPRSVLNWTKRISPKVKRNKPSTKIDMEALAKDVEIYSDSYQHERAKRLGVSKACIFYALKRLKVTYKKKPKTSKSQRRGSYFI